MDRLSTVVGDRRRLINIAYRLLGSVTDAEDAVQETFTRWCALAPEQQESIESPNAWLSKVVSRVCLDQLGSARVRRERYVGPWLPEPVPDRTEWSLGSHTRSADPAERITLDESVDMAFLIVLEAMTPPERVTFLLHDVFRYSFAEIAEMVGRTPAACRQLAYSARRRIPERPAEVMTAQRSDLIRSFRRAWESKDVTALVGLLDPTVVAVADGGGVVTAAWHPIEGRDEVTQYLIEVARLAGELTLLERTVNGQPGLVALHDETIAAVYAFEIADDRIRQIWSIRNPEKLRLWTNL
ncbi:RNA polymerase sigma factor SigJ [Kribbella sp. NPDC051952]|uniref:RNA polymerase sigma factor SigJ n=1 Tax=Kribbella sp. NPDC051952 TaxID=3154851 RepID=UPI00342DCC32